MHPASWATTPPRSSSSGTSLKSRPSWSNSHRTSCGCCCAVTTAASESRLTSTSGSSSFCARATSSTTGRLRRLVADREAFFAFLQERWPIFLDREAAKGTSGVREDEKPYGLSIEGPVELPFDHHDIRVYIDNLFVEGLLHSVPHEHADTLSKNLGRHRRSNRSHRGQVPSPGQAHRQPGGIHSGRGREAHGLVPLCPWMGGDDPAGERSGRSYSRIDGRTHQGLAGTGGCRFRGWLFKRYAGLVNLPPVPPVMLHHLPRFLARQMGEDRNSKIALIVVDGLAMDQWLVVREALASKQPGLRFREQAVFAWIPSLTSVSRQAAFAGKAPIFFPNSIQTTDKEPALWAQFWADHGLRQTRSSTSRGWATAVWRPFPKRFLIPRQGSPGWSWTRSTRSCTGWKWAPPGCTTRWASGPNSRT
jgi:hypothetical protein